MAAKELVATVFVLVMVASWLWPGSEAMTYTVGNSVGWKIPPNGTKFHDWASPYTFEVGDILLFNFRTGIHDVAVVTKNDFDACNISSPLETLNTGPASYSLDNEGDYYFICTFPTHCSRGQKLEIKVSTSYSGPNASPISGDNTPPPSPSPPKGSFASARSATYTLVIVSIVAGLI